MHDFKRIEHKFCQELYDELAERMETKNISSGNLSTIREIVHTIKCLCELKRYSRYSGEHKSDVMTHSALSEWEQEDVNSYMDDVKETIRKMYSKSDPHGKEVIKHALRELRKDFVI